MDNHFSTCCETLVCVTMASRERERECVCAWGEGSKIAEV